MVKCQIAVAEVIVVRRDFYPKAASLFIHPRKSCLRIRFPRVEHIHVVLTAAYLAQILNTIILLIAVNVVNLLFWKTTITDRPDSMVQINTNPSLVYITIYA